MLMLKKFDISIGMNFFISHFLWKAYLHLQKKNILTKFKNLLSMNFQYLISVRLDLIF